MNDDINMTRALPWSLKRFCQKDLMNTLSFSKTMECENHATYLR